MSFLCTHLIPYFETIYKTVIYYRCNFFVAEQVFRGELKRSFKMNDREIALLVPFMRMNVPPNLSQSQQKILNNSKFGYLISIIGPATKVTNLESLLDILIERKAPIYFENGLYIAGTDFCYSTEKYEVGGQVDGQGSRVIACRSKLGQSIEVNTSDDRLLPFAACWKSDEVLKAIPLGTEFEVNGDTRGALSSVSDKSLDLDTGSKKTTFLYSGIYNIKFV